MRACSSLGLHRAGGRIDSDSVAANAARMMIEGWDIKKPAGISSLIQEFSPIYLEKLQAARRRPTPPEEGWMKSLSIRRRVSAGGGARRGRSVKTMVSVRGMSRLDFGVCCSRCLVTATMSRVGGPSLSPMLIQSELA